MDLSEAAEQLRFGSEELSREFELAWEDGEDFAGKVDLTTGRARVGLEYRGWKDLVGPDQTEPSGQERAVD